MTEIYKALRKEYEMCNNKTDFHINMAMELMKKDKLSVEAAEHIHQAAVSNGKAIQLFIQLSKK
jgi:hypothetical protein